MDQLRINGYQPIRGPDLKFERGRKQAAGAYMFHYVCCVQMHVPLLALCPMHVPLLALCRISACRDLEAREPSRRTKIFLGIILCRVRATHLCYDVFSNERDYRPCLFWIGCRAERI